MTAAVDFDVIFYKLENLRGVKRVEEDLEAFMIGIYNLTFVKNQGQS